MNARTLWLIATLLVTGCRYEVDSKYLHVNTNPSNGEAVCKVGLEVSVTVNGTEAMHTERIPPGELQLVPGLSLFVGDTVVVEAWCHVEGAEPGHSRYQRTVNSTLFAIQVFDAGFGDVGRGETIRAPAPNIAM